ncbi:MAG TPA: NAD+ synthase [Gemmatimonadales bacterium]|nr:NAD+ synthase [Gemmatimonadales bacterium]
MPRLAIAQIKPRKGEYAANLERIAGVITQVAELEPPADLVVFPETATSGYFVEGGVREVAVTAGTLLRDLSARYQGRPIDVAVGFYEVFQNRYYNSCLYASLGVADPRAVRRGASIHHIHRKVFLPTYGVFDEGRFVERGLEIRAFDTRWGRAAILICEDAWHSISATIAALDGAQLILLPSASPARGTGPKAAMTEGTDEGGIRLPTSVLRWERTLRAMAEEHGLYVAYASLVGFEGGKGFAGGSVVVDPWGEIVQRGALFDESILTVDVNLDEITRARADAPLLADLETVLPHLVKNLGKREAGRGKGQARTVKFDPAAPEQPSPASPIPLPASPVAITGHAEDAGDPLHVDAELAQRWLVSFLRDEVVERRGFKKGIVGLSGGVDSALTAFLAARALGPENVFGVRMPYRTSSRESLDHAQLVIQQLGIQCLTVDISEAVDGYLRQSGGEGEVSPARKGNVMARERMIVLFDQSAKLDALPLGTGNKSERLLGYFTWHADDAPPVNPLGDLFKTQVWELARHVGVPEVIIQKPATADLIQGQTDEGDFGISYRKADLILYHLLRGLKPEEIAVRGFTPAEVELVRKRLESSHWKRRLPTVAVMSQTAIGEFYLRPVDY